MRWNSSLKRLRHRANSPHTVWLFDLRKRVKIKYNKVSSNSHLNIFENFKKLRFFQCNFHSNILQLGWPLFKQVPAIACILSCQTFSHPQNIVNLRLPDWSVVVWCQSQVSLVFRWLHVCLLWNSVPSIHTNTHTQFLVTMLWTPASIDKMWDLTSTPLWVHSEGFQGTLNFLFFFIILKLGSGKLEFLVLRGFLQWYFTKVWTTLANFKA